MIAAILAAFLCGTAGAAFLRLADSVGERAVDVNWIEGFTASAQDSPLDFREASLFWSNLGGLGPDVSQNEVLSEVLIFRKIGIGKNQFVDMRIEAVNPGEYKSDKPQLNKVWEDRQHMCQISIDPGTDVLLKVTFAKIGTIEPVEVPHFFLTIFDIDATDPSNNAAVETYTIGPIEGYYVSADHKLAVTQKKPKFWEFHATQQGDKYDNPTDPFALDDFQKSVAVMVEFKDTSTFELRFKATERPLLLEATGERGRGGKGGGSSSGGGSSGGANSRNMVIYGPAGMVTEPFGPCEIMTTVNFKGCQPKKGKGKGGAALLQSVEERGNVVTIPKAVNAGGTKVDLTVTWTSGSWNEQDPAKTMLLGDIFNINMGNEDSASFTFSFTSNDRPFELEHFFMTFFDIDQEGQGGSFESLTLEDGEGSFFLSEQTTLQTLVQGGHTTFKSSKYGNILDNLADVLNTVRQNEKAVTLYFPKVQSFTVKYTTMAVAGRNFGFGPVTKLACEQTGPPPPPAPAPTRGKRGKGR